MSENKITEEQAIKTLQKERADREQKCRELIEKDLKECNCKMNGSFIWSDGKAGINIRIESL